MTDARRAPVYGDALALAAWTLEHFGDDARALPRAVCRSVIRLAEDISLALERFEPEARLADADAELVMLRVHLRLAEETQLLTGRQLLHAAGLADTIGRQIGGWRRQLSRAHTRFDGPERR